VNPTAIRILTAFTSLGIFFGTYYFFEIWGFVVLCLLAAAGVIREFTNMNLPKTTTPGFVRYSFIALCLFYNFLFVFAQDLFLFGFSVCTLLFFSLLLLQTKRLKVPLDNTFRQVLIILLGFFYCTLLPGSVTKLLLLEGNGTHWFIAFVFIVFSVDTWAFFGGMAFGKTKLLPSISPKKTLEGALFGLTAGGLFGVLAAVFLLPDVPILLLGLVAILCGLLAETGDLFVSLMKRLAQVKDTGTLMPGHGGLMDRLDGLFFAAPAFYGFAVTVRTFG